MNIFSGLFLECLMYYDGPLLEVVAYEGNKYLLAWVDVDNVGQSEMNHYVAAQVTNQQVDAFKKQEISLSWIQKNSPQLYYGTCVGPKTTARSIKYEEISEDYRAPETAFYDPQFAPPK